MSGILLPFANTLEDPVVIKNILTYLKVHGTLVPTALLPEGRAPPHVGLFDEFHSAITSVNVVLSGLAYNILRNEKSELISNVRTAGFEILLAIIVLPCLIRCEAYTEKFLQRALHFMAVDSWPKPLLQLMRFYSCSSATMPARTQPFR